MGKQENFGKVEKKVLYRSSSMGKKEYFGKVEERKYFIAQVVWENRKILEKQRIFFGKVEKKEKNDSQRSASRSKNESFPL